MKTVSIKPKNINHSIEIGVRTVSGLWFYEITDNSQTEERVIVSHSTWNRNRILQVIDRYADLDSIETTEIKEYIRMNLDPNNPENQFITKQKSYLFRSNKSTID